MKYDTIIIGAGAAGLMCGITAGRRGRSVLILDHSAKTGSKIRVSGGGRCNFTNTNVSWENYLSVNPHFCRSALAGFTPSDITSMLKKHDIGFQEKEHGRLFCTGSSMDIVNMLGKECAEAGVKVRINSAIDEIGKDDIFTVRTGQENFLSDSVVIATGGLSYPVLGASDLGYRIARQFRINVTGLKPGLVPFTFDTADLKVFSQLSGISIDAAIKCGKTGFRENILFTHRGLSGPGILQISLYWNRGDIIILDLLPDLDVLELLVQNHQSKVELHNLMLGLFPKRFSRAWCDMFAPSRPLNQYSLKKLKDIAHRIRNWEIRPNGTEGYKKAEVTVGGIDPNELSSKTMETKKVPGLFFIGEVIDVTGQLGGYNLHWAWSSGYAAGQYA